MAKMGVLDNQTVPILRFSERNGVSVETERFSGNHGTAWRVVPRVVQAETKWSIGLKKGKHRLELNVASI